VQQESGRCPAGFIVLLGGGFVHEAMTQENPCVAPGFA
jgi:hypothetical protein